MLKFNFKVFNQVIFGKADNNDEWYLAELTVNDSKFLAFLRNSEAFSMSISLQISFYENYKFQIELIFEIILLMRICIQLLHSISIHYKFDNLLYLCIYFINDKNPFTDKFLCRCLWIPSVIVFVNIFYFFLLIRFNYFYVVEWLMRTPFLIKLPLLFKVQISFHEGSIIVNRQGLYFGPLGI